MAGQEALSVTILNRNYPPGQGITGESAAELASFLIAKGVTVNIVHVDAPYHGGHNEKKQPGNVFKIRTFYNGKMKFRRLLANLYEGMQLVIKSRKLNSNTFICMTDPPLLNFWAALLLGKKHQWLLWAMDLYPEAFVSGKLVTNKNIFYKAIDNVLLKNSPAHIITLGPHQAESLRAKYNNNIPITLLPCGIYDKHDSANTNRKLPSWASDRSKIYLGYCGNVGEAHSTDFLFSVIDHFDPSRYSLVLALYGTQAEKVLEYARQKKGVIVVNTVHRSELKYIDIHLASLVKDWVNVSVPSKTVSSVCAGSAFLYHGIPQSDNWTLLKEAGWIIEDADTDTAVKCFFKDLTEEDIVEKKKAAEQLARTLNAMKQNAFHEIYRKIAALHGYKVKAHSNDYAPSTVM